MSTTNEVIDERIRKAREELAADLKEVPSVNVDEFVKQAQAQRDAQPNPLAHEGRK